MDLKSISRNMKWLHDQQRIKNQPFQMLAHTNLPKTRRANFLIMFIQLPVSNSDA